MNRIRKHGNKLTSGYSNVDVQINLYDFFGKNKDLVSDDEILHLSYDFTTCNVSESWGGPAEWGIDDWNLNDVELDRNWDDAEMWRVRENNSKKLRPLTEEEEKEFYDRLDEIDKLIDEYIEEYDASYDEIVDNAKESYPLFWGEPEYKEIYGGLNRKNNVRRYRNLTAYKKIPRPKFNMHDERVNLDKMRYYYEKYAEDGYDGARRAFGPIKTKEKYLDRYKSAILMQWEDAVKWFEDNYTRVGITKDEMNEVGGEARWMIRSSGRFPHRRNLRRLTSSMNARRCKRCGNYNI